MILLKTWSEGSILCFGCVWTASQKKLADMLEDLICLMQNKFNNWDGKVNMEQRYINLPHQTSIMLDVKNQNPLDVHVHDQNS